MKIQHIEPEMPGLELQAKLVAAAKTKLKTAIAQVERYRRDLEKSTGCPIIVKRDAFDLEDEGTLTFAPGPRKSEGKYFIALRPIGAPYEPYVLARLLVQLECEHKDSLAGEPVIFAPNISCIQNTLPHHEASQSEQRKAAVAFGQSLIFSMKELFIESHLAAKIPSLVPLQKMQALFWGHTRAKLVASYYRVPGKTRTARSQANATICAANALQWDHLLKDTKISGYYQHLAIWPRAQTIHGIFQKHFSGSNPGAISQTFKEVCTLLGNPAMIRHHISPVTALKAADTTEISGPVR
jgi:hypothetical protein